MDKAFRYRIYPSKDQQVLINKTLGCTRCVYNYYLDKRKELWEAKQQSMTYVQCSADLTILKQQFEWLREVDKFTLQNSLKDLNTAYQNFFREIRKGNGNQGYPKFKSKHGNRQSCRTNYTNNNIELRRNMLKLPKIGWIKFANSRDIEGKIINATITRTPSGRYYVSICCDVGEIPQLTQNNNVIGMDLGLKEFAYISNGDEIANPKTLSKAEKKLKRLQRKISKKKIGSRNRDKARLKLARQHEKVADIRSDFLHKQSARLINENQVIILEDLKVKNMQKNRHLAKSISDASWGNFVTILEYKGTWYGRTVHKLNSFFPSTQLCSCCGYRNPDVKNLAVREWECLSCRSINHRDRNASLNIRQQGMKELGICLESIKIGQELPEYKLVESGVRPA